MSLKILAELEQGTEEWHEQRRGMVTASVVGKLVSARAMMSMEYACPECDASSNEPCLSKARGPKQGTPIQVPHVGRTALAGRLRDQSPRILEIATGDEAVGLTRLLAAERITGHTDPTYMSDDMWRGKEDEPRAIEVYSKHYAPVRKVGFMVRDDWGFSIGYSPDGVVDAERPPGAEAGLVEVKSRRQKTQLSTVLADDVPTENMAQLQCGLLVSGRAWIDYISFCGGMHLWRKRIHPDQQWFDVIVAAVAQFEANAAEMIATYNERTEGLPMTERAPDPFDVELKL